ncbi:MAG: tetratricopeptide repeat protein [Rhodospirillales bacterium]|nr:tetratricopeptide repeat protein [Rhodospirillales bacterium]
MAAKLSNYVGPPQGEGVPLDFGIATKWFELGADGSKPRVKFRIGKRFRDGERAPQNFKIAFRLFLCSAEMGVPEAQYELADMYLDGLGVPPNSVEAYKWLIIAAASDPNVEGRSFIEGATKARNELMKKMSPKEITKAQERAQNWKTLDIRNKEKSRLNEENLKKGIKIRFLLDNPCPLRP